MRDARETIRAAKVERGRDRESAKREREELQAASEDGDSGGSVGHGEVSRSNLLQESEMLQLDDTTDVDAEEFYANFDDFDNFDHGARIKDPRTKKRRRLLRDPLRKDFDAVFSTESRSISPAVITAAVESEKRKHEAGRSTVKDVDDGLPSSVSVMSPFSQRVNRFIMVTPVGPSQIHTPLRKRVLHCPRMAQRPTGIE